LRLTITNFFQCPPFQRVKAIFLTNYQPAFPYPLEELKSALLYLDANKRGCWEERSVDLGWMRRMDDTRVWKTFSTRDRRRDNQYIPGKVRGHSVL
jgi:hypothetical protein